MPAVEAERLAGPEPGDDLQRLVEVRGALLGVELLAEASEAGVQADGLTGVAAMAASATQVLQVGAFASPW
jgi:hypothetical protein